MARNEEKSQSMLFRFRESQAAELGLVGRTDRRPRIAATCKDLRQCERWRGEILRDVSRKVSKIQDFGLTDYEVRDLNDEINKLLREKNHWENQIMALGGANYKRVGVKMKDNDGKNVASVKGYKYFGRAKELPGVKELFSGNAADKTENESFKQVRQDPFANPGPNYYGDEDDADEELIKGERESEETDWNDAIEELQDDHSLSFSSLPPLPIPHFISLDISSSTTNSVSDPPPPSTDSEAAPGGKRKAPTDTSVSKKAKVDEEAEKKNGFYSVLEGDELKPPTLASIKEVEAFVVQQQKKALLAEYDA